MNNNIISDEDWDVVESRLESMPDSLHLGILECSYTKNELMEQVKKRSETGIAYAQMQLDFIKWIAKQSKIV